MILYYTGATEDQGKQDNPLLSLGGYISETRVPNDLLGSLISDITQIAIQTGKRQTYLLALKNTTGQEVGDVNIYFNYPKDNEGVNVSHITLKLAVVSPTLDDCSDLVFEEINSSSASPLTGTFVEANGSNNAIAAGHIENDKYIGIWIRAEVNKSNAQFPDCDTLKDNFDNNVELDTQQQFTLTICYDEDISDSISISC